MNRRFTIIEKLYYLNHISLMFYNCNNEDTNVFDELSFFHVTTCWKINLAKSCFCTMIIWTFCRYVMPNFVTRQFLKFTYQNFFCPLFKNFYIPSDYLFYKFLNYSFVFKNLSSDTFFRYPICKPIYVSWNLCI